MRCAKKSGKNTAPPNGTIPHPQHASTSYVPQLTSQLQTRRLQSTNQLFLRGKASRTQFGKDFLLIVQNQFKSPRGTELVDKLWQNEKEQQGVLHRVLFDRIRPLWSLSKAQHVEYFVDSHDHPRHGSQLEHGENINGKFRQGRCRVGVSFDFQVGKLLLEESRLGQRNRERGNEDVGDMVVGNDKIMNELGKHQHSSSHRYSMVQSPSTLLSVPPHSRHSPR